MYDTSENQSIINQLQSYSKAQIANRRYFKRLLWFTLLALLAASSYLLAHRPAFLSIDNALLALGITWIGFLPSLLYLLDRNRPPMAFLPLVGIFYATSFGLPMFNSDLKFIGRWSIALVSSTALSLVLLGVAGMIVAFYSSKLFLWKKVSPIRLPGPYSLNKLLTLLWILLLSHLAGLYIPFVQKIPSVGQFLDPIGFLAYGMLYILWARRKLPNVQAWLLFGVFLPLELIPRLASGLLSQVMIFGLFMLNIIWFVRKRLPVVLITIVIIIYLIFTPVKNEYRNLTWYTTNSSHLNKIEKIQLFVNLATKYYQSPHKNLHSKNLNDSPINSAISRAAQIVVFSQVIKDTPAKVPYWNGETYLPLLTSYIPRILWPYKPTETTGNKFGQRYHYLDKRDRTTAFNLPWIVEMYANFGTLGVLIGMPLVGLLLAFLEQKLNHPEMNALEFVLGATVLFNLVYQESNLSLMMGGVANSTIVLYLMMRFFLGNRSH